MAKETLNLMLEKLCWFMLYGFRGFIHAVPFMFLSLALIFISSKLYSINEISIYKVMPVAISKGIISLTLISLAVPAIVWIMTWVGDYRRDHLPNWIKRQLY